jgi:hypothetical protein
VPERPFTDAEIDAAVAALSDPDRFREAESMLARVAPQLQRVLNQALEDGGWFGEAHDGQVLKAATTPDPDERITAVRTLLAEETRIGMMVGVAVGWELRRELGTVAVRGGGRGAANQPDTHGDDSETETEES